MLGAVVLPEPLRGGLIVAAAVPCTVASATIWTRRANGDDSVSILVTLATNALCFLITPATLWLLMDQQVRVAFSEQVARLAVLIVLPLALAQIVRLSGSARRAVDTHRGYISVFSQLGILVMVAFGMAASTDRVAGANVGSTSYALMLIVTASIHVAAFWGGFAIAGSLGLRA